MHKIIFNFYFNTKKRQNYLQLLFHTKCCSSIKQVKNLGSSILYTYVKNTTPVSGGV